MKPTTLLDDLDTLLGAGADETPASAAIRHARRAQWATPENLVQIALHAGIGVVRGAALVLKNERERHDQACVHRQSHYGDPAAPADAGAAHGDLWAPWETLPDYQAWLAALDGCPRGLRFEVLVRELWVLGCHEMATADVARLATHMDGNDRLLDAADEAARAAFVQHKADWLRQEGDLARLLLLKLRLDEHQGRVRWKFLATMNDVYLPFVRAARRLAMARYRLRLDDSTLTDEELGELISLDLRDAVDRDPLVALDAELQLALQDNADGVRDDLTTLRSISTLSACGVLMPAPPEEVQYAADLYRRLSRRLHPDLRSAELRARLSAADNARLDEIFRLVTPRHRARTLLPRPMLLDHCANLRRYLREVDVICRNAGSDLVRDPFRLIDAPTLDEQRRQIDAVCEDALRQQHALRDELAQRRFDPLFLEFERINRLDEAARSAERQRMVKCTQTWSDAAELAERDLEQRGRRQEAR
jgi:hypothetical protein